MKYSTPAKDRKQEELLDRCIGLIEMGVAA